MRWHRWWLLSYPKDCCDDLYGSFFLQFGISAAEYACPHKTVDAYVVPTENARKYVASVSAEIGDMVADADRVVGEQVRASGDPK